MMNIPDTGQDVSLQSKNFPRGSGSRLKWSMTKGELRIGIVNLNLGIDKIYIIENFRENDVFRPSRLITSLGGKGMNVARVLRELRVKTEIFSVAGRINENIIERNLEKEKFNLKKIFFKGESRECIIISDPVTNRQTVINEKGLKLNKGNIKRMKREFREFRMNKKIMIFSGSVPRGVPDNIYGYMIKKSKIKGIRCFLDTSGKFLAEGIKAKPFMIKPNIFELQDITSRKLRSIEDVAKRAVEIAEEGIQWVIVSMCEKGVVFCYENMCWHAEIPPVNMKSTVGSGDSLVAGFTYSYLRNYSIENIIRMSTACAVANSLSVKPGSCRIEDIDKLNSEIKIRKIH